MTYHFDEIKQQVNILDVAKYYGVNVNSHGKALCPFHREDTASFSINTDKQIFYCFGCGAGGDIFTLASKLLNISNFEALKIINNDFHCGLDLDKPISRKDAYDYKKKQELEEQFTKWFNKTYNELCDYFQLLRTWKRKCNPDDPQYIEALQNIDKVEYYIDFLASASDKEKIQFWKQKVVTKIVESS